MYNLSFIECVASPGIYTSEALHPAGYLVVEPNESIKIFKVYDWSDVSQFLPVDSVVLTTSLVCSKFKEVTIMDIYKDKAAFNFTDICNYDGWFLSRYSTMSDLVIHSAGGSLFFYKADNGYKSLTSMSLTKLDPSVYKGWFDPINIKNYKIL